MSGARSPRAWVTMALGALIGFGAAAPAAAREMTLRHTEHFTFEYPARAEKRLAEIIESADGTLEELGRRWGATGLVTAEPRIRVIVASDRAHFDEVQLGGGAEPWMAATAYPSRHLIVLSLESTHFFRLEEIARHEISHVALHRAAGGARMPRWLDEGLAILVAGEDVAERLKTAAGAAFTGRTIPLASLERGFPSEDGLARLAYALSATFCRWLDLRYGLGDKLPAVLARVRTGTAPGVALQQELGLPISRLEEIWLQELGASWTWLAIVTDAGAIWAIAGVVAFFGLLVAYRRRRRRLAALGTRADDEEVWPPSPMPLSGRRPADEDGWP